ncbi:hypothetical protein TSOC_001052 [Tetrabaena socialis]|uniref:MYND-type domain-containing protein n=1 Tax=Tetrabaena socialis TaxID=47790 RepID=A0A2J8AHP5_9CHLO|nr:hypothetical protein TSOC_001052 [Tetrabaena socialis]|eukprot:PNH12039.1 hypothetical protein TSOC_001052 [Tetrabaena socialis]
MASRFEDEQPAVRECANCGAADELLRCSRCRSEWFCSLACHKFCRRNEFADVLEEGDPRFAGWLRQHGKQAIIGDAEVDRLERAGRAVMGPGREALLSSVGIVTPIMPVSQTIIRKKPTETSPPPHQARLMSRQDLAWSAITIEPGMGMECARPGSLSVASGAGEQPIAAGELYGSIKAELSTWFVDDGLLHVELLKCCRRGHYAPGATNADTWWPSVWRRCPPGEAMQRPHPPTRYYWWGRAEYEECDLPPEQPTRPLARRPVARLEGAAQPLLDISASGP